MFCYRRLPQSRHKGLGSTASRQHADRKVGAFLYVPVEVRKSTRADKPSAGGEVERVGEGKMVMRCGQDGWVGPRKGADLDEAVQTES